jgi:hypothetical protein
MLGGWNNWLKGDKGSGSQVEGQDPFKRQQILSKGCQNILVLFFFHLFIIASL